jgi:superfamily II DNA or RNA helicase
MNVMGRGGGVTTMGEPTAASDAPAQGQLVTVRNRVWVVSDVVESTLAPQPQSLTGRPTHVVTLISIEDDAHDEQLRIVWELERGAVAHDQHTLPDPADGFDDPGQLDAFLDAVRWGAIASADKTVLQAPFRSGVTITDYQLDPVVRALSMPRTNLLIADDVGLGKTVEAGLVMQELTLRHRARTMLIVCPAGLTLQWRDEMRDKFGLDFRIVDTALLKELRRSRGPYTNPWTHYPLLIVSIDWLKRDRPMRLLREILPQVPKYPRTFDLLVVDEVHTCAPQARGRYAVDSLRTTAIRTLAPHCEHRLFLSATPHNGYLESFTALLEMLDGNRFVRNVKPNEEQLRRIMVRRMKRDVPPKWDGTPAFSVRKTESLDVDHSSAEREAYRLLTEYAASRQEAAKKQSGDAGVAAANFVIMLLKKRLFSSPKAFAETIERHLVTMTARSESEDAVLARADAKTSLRVLRPLVERLDETAEDDTAFIERQEEALAAARRLLGPPLTQHEKDLLQRLGAWARQAQDRPDPKFEALRAWLDQYVPGERVIVFTEYRDTQRWLFERLIGAGYPAEWIAQLYGGQDQDEREHVKAVFQDDPALDPVRILLATDAASEGINLQNHCHQLLHWEIPWNPNRLEQRNGRIDRFRQPSPEVNIYHFVPKGWEDDNPGKDDGALEDELHFLWVAAKKTEQIREDLGSAGDVIAAQVEQKMLGKREDWQAVDAEIERKSKASRAELKVIRDLAHDLQRFAEILRESRGDLHLTPEAVEHVVGTALKLAFNKDLTSVKGPANFQAPCFRIPELPGTWAAARNNGLYHPITHKELPITFDRDAAAERTDVVLLHLGHPLVQMCLRLLRAELWATARKTEKARLHRVTARVVPSDMLRVPVVLGHIRVVVTGAEGTRLHEEIVLAGGTIEGGKLVRTTEENLRALLAVSSAELPPDQVTKHLAELWPRLSGTLTGFLEHRQATRRRSLATLIADRCAEEVAGMAAILNELEQSIRLALDDTPRWEQGSIFELETERQQLRKDHEALKERLASIPATREQEDVAIKRHYADPRSRWFPVAVTFLVPASIAKGVR